MINDKGLSLIKKYEGCRLKAYQCPAAIWTIGYGHTNNVKEGDVITQDEADKFLQEDLRQFETQLKSLKLSLSENQYAALVSFIYNCGFGTFKKSGLLRNIQNYAAPEIIRQSFMRYVYGGGKILPGLVKRREEEANLFFSI
jgi:lysozyme